MCLSDIKTIIGIVSCKGGVGKTTTAINLAVLLNRLYKKSVGIFDADIHGPNHPKMFGVSIIEKSNKCENLLPRLCYGVQSMSMGYFLNEGNPVLLRGPMVSNTVFYLLKKTKWGKLDFLIIDFPPGTGDVYLNLLKNIKIKGVYIITTPQEVSIQDVKRSACMLKKFNVPIFGLLENMKFFKCDNCGHKEHFYREGFSVKKSMIDFDIPFFYDLPMSKKLRELCDIGVPIVSKEINGEISQVYSSMIKQMFTII